MKAVQRELLQCFIKVLLNILRLLILGQFPDSGSRPGGSEHTTHQKSAHTSQSDTGFRADANADEPLPEKHERVPKPAHEVLGVSENATLEEVKKAYRQAALKTHPDKCPEDAMAAERFRAIHTAYQELLRRLMPPTSESDSESEVASDSGNDESDTEYMESKERDMIEQMRRIDRLSAKWVPWRPVTSIGELLHPYAISIRERCYDALNMYLGADYPFGVVCNLGGAATVFHVCAFYGDEKALTIVMSLAANAWAKAICGKFNYKTPLQIARSRHPGSKVWERLDDLTDLVNLRVDRMNIERELLAENDTVDHQAHDHKWSMPWSILRLFPLPLAAIQACWFSSVLEAVCTSFPLLFLISKFAAEFVSAVCFCGGASCFCGVSAEPLCRFQAIFWPGRPFCFCGVSAEPIFGFQFFVIFWSS